MQSLALLLAVSLLPGQEEKVSQAEIRALVGKLGVESIKEREEATSRLARIGERALPQLRANFENPDPEIVQRVRYLVTYIELDRIVPLALRRHHPGVFRELLLGGDPVWTRVFLEAAWLKEVKPRELNPFAARAVRGAGSPTEEIQVARFIKTHRLEAGVPAILERLRRDEHHPPPAFARVGVGMPFSDPNEQMTQRSNHHLVVGWYLGALVAGDETEEVVEFLANDCPTFRFQALASLVETRDRQFVPEIIPLLRDPDDWVKARAVLALSQLGARDRWKEIAALLADRKSDVRRAARKALSRLEAKEAIPAVVALLRHKRTAGGAAWTLGRLGAMDAVPEIKAHLSSHEPVIRRSAILAMRELHATSAVGELIEMLEDPSPTVRRTAASTLGALGAMRAVPPLIELLNDPECGWSVLSSLGELEAKEAVPKIIPFLKDPAGQPIRAMRALAEINSRDQIAACARYLDSEDRAERRAAIWALGELHAVEYVPQIRRCLKDPDDSVRCAAVLALGTLESREAAGDLAPLLGDKDGQVRADTARTLARLEARTHRGHIKTLLKDKSSYVREVAAESLALLGSGDGIPVILDGGAEETEFESLNSHCSSILDSLNALRDPEGWSRIRDARVTRTVEAPIAEALVELAKTAGLKPELPKEITEAPWSTIDRRIRARHGRKSVLEAVEELLPNTHVFVLDGTTIRIMNRRDAVAFWRTWWEAQGEGRAKK